MIRQAVLKFVTSGKPGIVGKHYHDAVKLGLCAVSSNSNVLTLEEALIVEAVLVRFSAWDLMQGMGPEAGLF